MRQNVQFLKLPPKPEQRVNLLIGTLDLVKPKNVSINLETFPHSSFGSTELEVKGDILNGIYMAKIKSDRCINRSLLFPKWKKMFWLRYGLDIILKYYLTQLQGQICPQVSVTLAILSPVTHFVGRISKMLHYIQILQCFSKRQRNIYSVSWRLQQTGSTTWALICLSTS